MGGHVRRWSADGCRWTPAIRTWLGKHPRFQRHFTSTGSSWIKQVERWFGFLADQMIRRGAHKNVQALEAAIRAWVMNWNEDPTPFIWTKTAEDILDSLARFCRRISGAGHWLSICRPRSRRVRPGRRQGVGADQSRRGGRAAVHSGWPR